MYKKSQFFYTLPMSNICTQRTFHGGGDLSHMIVDTGINIVHHHYVTCDKINYKLVTNVTILFSFYFLFFFLNLEITTKTDWIGASGERGRRCSRSR